MYTWLAVRLPGALIAVLAGLLVAPLLITLDPVSLLQYGILGGFLGGVLAASLLHESTQDTQNHPEERAGRLIVKRVAVSALIGLTWGVISGRTMSPGYPSGGWPFQGIYSSVVIGLSCLLLMILLPRSAPEQFQARSQNTRRDRWSQLRRKSALHGWRALLAATILGGGIGLSYGVSMGASHGVSQGLYYGLSYGLSYGVLGLLTSLILGMQVGDIHLAERLRWTRESLLRSLFISKHLRSTLGRISIILVLFGLSQGIGQGLNLGLAQGLNWGSNWGLSQGLSWGVSWGLGCWLLLGLSQGISGKNVEDKQRWRFNQGIRDSLRNTVVMSVIGAVVIGGVSVLSWGLSNELSYGLNYGRSWGPSYELIQWLSLGLSMGLRQGLSYAWPFVVSGGLLAGAALGGGLAILRHYALRFLLWRAQNYFADRETGAQEQGLSSSEDHKALAAVTVQREEHTHP